MQEDTLRRGVAPRSCSLTLLTTRHYEQRRLTCLPQNWPHRRTRLSRREIFRTKSNSGVIVHCVGRESLSSFFGVNRQRRRTEGLSHLQSRLNCLSILKKCRVSRLNNGSRPILFLTLRRQAPCCICKLGLCRT